VASKMELWRLSLHLASDISMVKYWARIVQLRQAYNFQAQQENRQSKKSWFKHVKQLIQSNVFNSYWMNQHKIKRWDSLFNNLSNVISDNIKNQMIDNIKCSSKL
jgi:hypothetical protein